MKVIFSGTFSPPTLGHLDTIKRGAALFHFVAVAIGSDAAKSPSPFSLEERRHFLEVLTAQWKNVSVSSFEGLLIDHAKSVGAQAILRSVRSVSDLEREKVLAETNRRLSGLETLFLFADPILASISSTLIRDLASKRKRLKLFVPGQIEEDVFKRLSNL